MSDLIRPRVVGLDLSSRGTGAVELDEQGIVNRVLFFTKTKGLVKTWSHDNLVSVRYSPDVTEDDASGLWKRLVETAEEVLGFIHACRPALVAIEEIPFGAQGNSIRQLYDLHALIRYGLTSGGLAFKESERPIRYYNVMDVKLYGTGHGHAKKPEMVAAADASGFDCSQFKKSGEDVADAYFVARMIQTEAALRTMQLQIRDLSPNAARVFFKQKSKAVAYVDRPFLTLTGI